MARAVGGYVNVATLVHSGAPFLFERPPDALSTGCRQEGWGNGVHRHEHTGGRRRKQACTHMRARARCARHLVRARTVLAIVTGNPR